MDFYVTFVTCLTIVSIIFTIVIRVCGKAQPETTEDAEVGRGNHNVFCISVDDRAPSYADVVDLPPSYEEVMRVPLPGACLSSKISELHQSTLRS